MIDASFEIRHDTQALLGEGLFVQNGEIYWVDIESQRVFWEGDAFDLPEDIPSVILDKTEDVLLIGTHRGIGGLASNGEFTLHFTLPGHDLDLFRLNDGCKLSDGSYLVGSMSRSNPAPMAGVIYHFDGAGVCQPWNWPCHIPNSFIELPDGSVLISDSLKQTVFKLDRSAPSSTPEIWYRTADGTAPDGGCLLPNGHIAIAIWNGCCIRVLDKNGQPVKDITVPFRKPTNCKFDVKTGKLLVTSARVETDTNELYDYPLSGNLIALDIGL